MLQVLLIEDTPVNQKAMRFVLEKFNCQVEIAENGEDAVIRLTDVNQPKIDVVFSDGNLGTGLTGPDVFKRLFNSFVQVSNFHPFVITWTTCTTKRQEFETVFADNQFVSYKHLISKPTSPAKVVEILKSCLSQDKFLQFYLKTDDERAMLSRSAPLTRSFEGLSLEPSPLLQLSVSSTAILTARQALFHTPQPSKPKISEEEKENDSTNVVVIC